MNKQQLKKWIGRLLLFLLFIVVYLASALSSVLFFGEDEASNKVIITGHRGAAGLAPENTLAAIRKGISFNVDRIEIDVQQTADGVVVVRHDETLNRTTNGKGLIKDRTFLEIKKLDAGSSFSSEYKGEKIPSLEEVLQTVNGRCDLVIEIKKGNDFYPNIVENTIELIEKYNAQDWCIMHSFNIDALVHAHKLMPELRLHRLFVVKLRGLPLIYDGSIDVLNIEKHPFIEEYSIMYNFANQGIIDQLHKHGKRVNVWTVDDKKHINRLINLGVDGIITDRPDLFNE